MHCAKKPVTTMLTYPWKCRVLRCNHLGNTWKPLVLMTARAINQSVGSSSSVVSRCFPGGYNVKLYISRGRLAWWLLAFLCYDVGSTIGVILPLRDNNSYFWFEHDLDRSTTHPTLNPITHNAFHVPA